MNSLKGDMVIVTNMHGHADPIRELAASVEWNIKWAATSQEKRLARAAQLLAEAAEIMAQIEAEEAEMKADMEQLGSSPRRSR